MTYSASVPCYDTPDSIRKRGELMGELYNPYPKLPKNIRQIGERDQTVRLYVEDYVNTYLKRLFPKGGQDLRVGVLLGTAEEHDGTPYLFVDGAMEMEDVTENGEKVVFSETAWKKTYQTMEQMFPKRVILGWFLCGLPGSALSPLNYWKQHGQYFAGRNQLMYLNSGLDGEEAAYVASEDGFYRLRGYSIYYERNQMMQDYMILRKDVRRVESGAGDTVIRDFRQRMEENKSQVTARRGTIRVLGGLCTALTVLVLAGGVAMMGNYQRMKEMEAVIASVLPAGTQKEEQTAGRQGDVIVEEAPAGIRLITEDSVLERETMSGEYPADTGSYSVVGIDRDSAGDTDEGSAGASDTDSAGADGAAETGDSAGTADTNPAGADGAAETADSSGTDGASDSASGQEDSRQALAGQKVYQVQEGETLYGICLKLYGSGSLLDEICRLNGLEDENKIMAGQNLILP